MRLRLSETYRGVAKLLDELQELIPQLEEYVADEELHQEVEKLQEENARLSNHVMAQDRLIAELTKASA